MSDLKTMIENAWDNRDSISPSSVSSDVKQAIIDALELLDSGAARVAEKISGEWVVHQWLKKAVLTNGLKKPFYYHFVFAITNQ